MKKTILFVMSSMMVSLFISCSQEEITENSSSVDLKSALPAESEQNFNVPNEESVYTLEEIDKLIQQTLEKEYKGYSKIEKLEGYIGNEAISNNIDSENPTSKKAQPLYPYSVASVKRKIRDNDQIIISSGDSGLAVGSYFCDIYEHKAEVILPTNTFAIAKVPNPRGYNNISQQTLGITQYINAGPTENKFVILTYTIHVKYNILGQYINVTVPNYLAPGFLYHYRLIS